MIPGACTATGTTVHTAKPASQSLTFTSTKMEANKTYDIIELQKMEVPELIKLAKTFGLIAHLWPKQTIIYSILNEQSKQL
jgi:hypothetical protein